MTYDQLIALQGWAALFLLLCLAAGTIHLLLGLIKPSWVRRAGRGRVVLLSIAVWFLGIAAYAGTIGYTHSHPNGPHSLKGYLDDYFAEQCAQGADIPACKDGATPGAAEPQAPAP